MTPKAGGYVGERGPDGPSLELQFEDGSRAALPAVDQPRYDQFEWGYSGGGALHSAAAILADQLRERAPEEMESAFSHEIVENLDRDGFAIPVDDVASWIELYRRRPEYRNACEERVIGIALREPAEVLRLGEAELPLPSHFSEPRRRRYWEAVLEVVRGGESPALDAVIREVDDPRAHAELDMLCNHMGHLYGPHLAAWCDRLVALPSDS